MADISGKTIEKDIAFPVVDNILYTESGTPDIPTTGDGIEWGSLSSQNSATVVLNWRRQASAQFVSSPQTITEIVTATDSSGNTRVGAVRDVSKFPPIFVDDSPPDDEITYTITVVYENENETNYAETSISTSVNTSSQPALPWGDSISNTTNRLVNISLPLSPPSSETVVSDTLTGLYEGTETTLITGGVPRNVHDVAAPNGEIIYTHEIVTEDSSGVQTTTNDSVTVNTTNPTPPSFGKVSKRSVGTTWTTKATDELISGSDLAWVNDDTVTIIDNVDVWQ